LDDGLGDTVKPEDDCDPGQGKDVHGDCVDCEDIDQVTGECIDCPVDQVRNSSGSCVDDCETTETDLKNIFSTTTNNKITEIKEAIDKFGQDFGLDTKEKLQHFLSQAGHESAKFNKLEENLNYRWKKLGTSYWSKYFNPVSNPTADPNKENPNDYKKSETSDFVDNEKFANYVYNDENRTSSLGNTSNGDGYKFRGRGVIQLTGKSNYQDFTNFYQTNYYSNKDFIKNPELLASDMEIAMISAMWFFKNNVLDKLDIDSKTTVKEVTKKVNGGTNGLDDRKEIHSEAKNNIDCAD
jgi:putative chitinase